MPKITDLSAASTLDGSEELPVHQGSSTAKTTVDDIATYAASSGVADDSITNAKLAEVSTATIKGRTTAGTGNPEDLTATQATALLNAVVGDSGSGGTKGLVPAPSAGDAAAGKFLKADGTFAVPSGSSGALALLEQHTASNSATLDFTTGISATYDTYIFELVDVQAATSTANLLMRVGTGGTPTYQSGASDYNWASQVSNSAAVSAALGSGGTTAIELAASCGSGATDAVVGTVKLFNPASTTFHKRFTYHIFYANSAGTFSQRPGGGSYVSTTAVTAIRFLMSAGNIAAGTIRMYGVAK